MPVFFIRGGGAVILEAWGYALQKQGSLRLQKYSADNFVVEQI